MDVSGRDGLALQCLFEEQFQLLFLLDFLEDEPNCYCEQDYKEEYDFDTGYGGD